MDKKYVKCVYCDNNNVNYKDHYKYEIKKDNEYLGIMDIYECINCKLSFSYPMPDEKMINYFYSKIYRSKHRPHYFDIFYKNNSYLDEINLDYLSYLTALIDFENIESLLDFGAGLGNIGFALKHKFKKLQLYSCETDEHCIETLEARGYTNFVNLDSINIKFDLVVSLHALEHLTNINPIVKLIYLLNENGYLFFEVPNNDFNTSYINRVFDSPHLLFYNKVFLDRLFNDLNMKKIGLIYTSYNIHHEIENQLSSYNNLSRKNIQWYIIKYLKLLAPDFVIMLRRKYNALKKLYNVDKLKWYLHGTTDSRCIRGLFVKQK